MTSYLKKQDWACQREVPQDRLIIEHRVAEDRVSWLYFFKTVTVSLNSEGLGFRRSLEQIITTSNAAIRKQLGFTQVNRSFIGSWTREVQRYMLFKTKPLQRINPSLCQPLGSSGPSTVSLLTISLHASKQDDCWWFQAHIILA
jgi:hypothetical protein